MNYRFNINILVILCLVLTACTKEISVEQFGSLKGRVYASIYPTQNLEGVKVVLVSGNFSMETKSEKNGIYSFDNVPIGTYNIIYTKENYGTYINYGIQLFGGHIPIEIPYAPMVQTPDYKLNKINIETSGSIYSDNTSYLNLNVEYQHEKSGQYLLLFSRNPEISLSKYTYSTISSFYKGKGYRRLNYTYKDFPAGSKWNFAAYPINSSANYIDPETGNNIYYGANEANVITGSFVVAEPEQF